MRQCLLINTKTLRMGVENKQKNIFSNYDKDILFCFFKVKDENTRS